MLSRQRPGNVTIDQPADSRLTNTIQVGHVRDFSVISFIVGTGSVVRPWRHTMIDTGGAGKHFVVTGQ
jgi:hypothetical protein